MSDAEMPSVFSDTIKKSRREHKCCECRQPIKVGEKYHLSKVCWEGEWSEYKTCLSCDELRDELKYDDELPPFGYLSEWAHEAGIEFHVWR